MAEVALALHAMATRFELLLYGDNAVALRAAGEEALAEIERLENVLSLYRPQSEIAHVNALAAHEAVRISPPVFSLLSHARQLWEETGGAFDITIAPLVRCWGFMGGTGHMPETRTVEQARQLVGMHLVELDAQNFTVRFQREGVMLDLGAIGKGYAIDRAVELLRDSGVESALLHGGTSTSYALGHPPDQPNWSLLVECPPLESTGAPPPRHRIELRDSSLSMSGIWGRAFKSEEGNLLGHILDPRTGSPVQNAIMSVVVLPSATETDALSTALLVAGEPELERFRMARLEGRALLVRRRDQGLELISSNLDGPSLH